MAGLAAVTKRIQLFATCAVLTMPPPIAARMAVTIDSISHGRFGVNIISGWQRAEYTQMGIWPGAEHYARRYDYCAEYVQVMKELWATGAPTSRATSSRWTIAAACRCRSGEDPDHLRRAERRRHALRRRVRRLQFLRQRAASTTPTAVAPSVARLVQATEDTGRKCGALVLTMIIADETDAAAEAKWEHYKAGTDHRGAGLARQPGRRTIPSKDPFAGPNRRRTLGDEQAADQPGRARAAPMRKWRACWTRWRRCPASQGVMMTFDDFVIGMEQFGTRIMPLMRCRDSVLQVA